MVHLYDVGLWVKLSSDDQPRSLNQGNGVGYIVSYVVALEEGQAQVVGHMFCNGRLATCRGTREEEDIPGPLFRWLLTHCVICIDFY